MNFKSIITKTIAVSCLAGLATACKPSKIEENPLLFGLASSQITGLAQGNCAISVNHTGLSYGQLVQTAAGNAVVAAGPTTIAQAIANPGGINQGALVTAWVTHYNTVNGTSVDPTATGLTQEPYNKKYDTFFTDGEGWNQDTRRDYLRFTELAIDVGGSPYQLLKAVRGTALVACAKIPRANCSVGALTTRSKSVDIKNQENVLKAIKDNNDCRKNETLIDNLNNSLFSDTNLAGFSRSQTGTPDAGANIILAERAYPKFGNLVSLGFGQLMPIQSGRSAYELTETAFNLGSNMNARVVSSCESIGIEEGIGQNPLTPTSEVVYAFSTPGQAASFYAALQVASGLTEEDAVQCNMSMRNIVNNGLPLALRNAGITIDTTKVATSGSGDTTDLLGVCIYGGDADGRNNASILLGSALVTGFSGLPLAVQQAAIPRCEPSKALRAVSAFGDEGLRSFSATDDGTAINGQ